VSDVPAAQLAAKTEPTTPRSSLAELRDEITRQIVILPENELAQYQAHCQAVAGSYEAVGPREQLLAQSIAELRWRINRIRTIENNLLAIAFEALLSDNPEVNAATAQAETFRRNHPVFNTLSICERRTYQNMEKELTELKSLQAERKALAQAEAEAQAKAEKAKAEQTQAELNEAVKLQNLCKSEGQPFDPQEFGFVFSSEEIEWEAWRRDRHRAAQIAANRTPIGRIPRPTHKKPPEMATN